MTFRYLITLTLILLGSIFTTFAQGGIGDAPLPLPTNAIEGYLSNGLHYIILPHPIPKGRAEVRLVLRVGSLDEREGEEGNAHFLEHLAFGGTELFPERSVVTALERLGMKYGQDINAMTGHDRTIYMFAVPTDKQGRENIALSIQIVSEWLAHMAILPHKVESEKGIIKEELRAYDVNDPFYSLKIGMGKHRRHIPLGEMADIEATTRERLNSFYQRCYTPERATLIIVGDIDGALTEQEVQRLSSLPQRGLSHGEHYSLLYPQGVSLQEITEKYRQDWLVELIVPHPTTVVNTYQQALNRLTQRLLMQVLTNYFRSSPYSLEASNQWYLADTDHWVLSFREKDPTQLLACIKNCAAHLSALVRKGWSEDLLAQWKESLLKWRSPISVSERPSALLCDDFVDYALTGDRVLIEEPLFSQLSTDLRQVSSKDLQAMLSDWITYADSAFLVTLRSPEQDVPYPFTSEDIQKAWSEGRQMQVSLYEYCSPNRNSSSSPEEDRLLSTPSFLRSLPSLDRTAIVEKHYFPSINTYEVLLRNGIRVILKPTEGSDSTIYLSSFCPGGLSAIPLDSYAQLEGAAGYVDMAGIESVHSDEWSELLYREGIALTTAMESQWHGFAASVAKSNLPLLMNLLREKIFRPERDYEAFESIRADLRNDLTEEKPLIRMLRQDPARQLAARSDALMGVWLPPRGAVATREEVDSLSLDRMVDFYQSLYAITEGACYLLTGVFDAEEVLPIVVGVLSSFPTVSSPKNVPQKRAVSLMNVPKIEHFVASSPEQVVAFNYLLSGTYSRGLRQSLILKIMRDILRERLIRELREREALVYSPYVSLSFSGLPVSIFYFDLNATANPHNLKRIRLLLEEIVRDLQRKPITADELRQIKQSFLIAKRETLTSDAAMAWRDTLVTLLKNGERVEDFANYEFILQQISPEEVQSAFSSLISLDRAALLYISPQSIDL